MVGLRVHPAGDAAALRYELPVDPAVPTEHWRLSVPAAAGTYLLLDTQHRPILLAVTGDLRRELADRLGPPRQIADATVGGTDASEGTGPAHGGGGSGGSPRTDYRAITREVRFRPAGSRFEAEWAYVVNARRWFPERCAALIEPWRTWWVTLAHLPTSDPGAAAPAGRRLPRLEVRSRPAAAHAAALGPLPTRASARGLIDSLTDLFELCRDYEILLQTPNGRACAYKELGRCPAPCDGSVPLATYYRALADAVTFAGGAHAGYLDAWRRRMRTLAEGLQFEQAERLRQRIERAEHLLGGSPCVALTDLQAQRRLLLQRGRGKHTARAFAVTPGRIDFLGQIQRRDRARQLTWLAGCLDAALDAPAVLDDAGLDLLSFAGWYRLRAERDPGIWLTATQAKNPAQLNEAIDALW